MIFPLKGLQEGYDFIQEIGQIGGNRILTLDTNIGGEIGKRVIFKLKLKKD